MPFHCNIDRHVVSSFANCLEQKKVLTCEKSSIPTGIVHKHGRRFIFLYTNMAAVTSCENDLMAITFICHGISKYGSWCFLDHFKPGRWTPSLPGCAAGQGMDFDLFVLNRVCNFAMSLSTWYCPHNWFDLICLWILFLLQVYKCNDYNVNLFFRNANTWL